MELTYMGCRVVPGRREQRPSAGSWMDVSALPRCSVQAGPVRRGPFRCGVRGARAFRTASASTGRPSAPRCRTTGGRLRWLALARANGDRRTRVLPAAVHAFRRLFTRSTVVRSLNCLSTGSMNPIAFRAAVSDCISCLRSGERGYSRFTSRSGQTAALECVPRGNPIVSAMGIHPRVRLRARARRATSFSKRGSRIFRLVPTHTPENQTVMAPRGRIEVRSCRSASGHSPRHPPGY